MKRDYTKLLRRNAAWRAGMPPKERAEYERYCNQITQMTQLVANECIPIVFGVRRR